MNCGDGSDLVPVGPDFYMPRRVTVRYEVLGEEHLLAGHLICLTCDEHDRPTIDIHHALTEAQETGFLTVEGRNDKRVMIPWERVIGVVEQ